MMDNLDSIHRVAKESFNQLVESYERELRLKDSIITNLKEKLQEETNCRATFATLYCKEIGLVVTRTQAKNILRKVAIDEHKRAWAKTHKVKL